jgi:hypothetical protein
MSRSRTPGPRKERLIGRRVTFADGRRGVICKVEFGSVLRDQLYYLVRLDHQYARDIGPHVIAAHRCRLGPYSRARWARDLRRRTPAARAASAEVQPHN